MFRGFLCFGTTSFVLFLNNYDSVHYLSQPKKQEHKVQEEYYCFHYSLQPSRGYTDEKYL